MLRTPGLVIATILLGLQPLWADNVDYPLWSSVSRLSLMPWTQVIPPEPSHKAWRLGRRSGEHREWQQQVEWTNHVAERGPAILASLLGEDDRFTEIIEAPSSVAVMNAHKVQSADLVEPGGGAPLRLRNRPAWRVLARATRAEALLVVRCRVRGEGSHAWVTLDAAVGSATGETLMTASAAGDWKMQFSPHEALDAALLRAGSRLVDALVVRRRDPELATIHKVALVVRAHNDMASTVLTEVGVEALKKATGWTVLRGERVQQAATEALPAPASGHEFDPVRLAALRTALQCDGVYVLELVQSGARTRKGELGLWSRLFDVSRSGFARVGGRLFGGQDQSELWRWQGEGWSKTRARFLSIRGRFKQSDQQLLADAVAAAHDAMAASLSGSGLMGRSPRSAPEVP